MSHWVFAWTLRKKILYAVLDYVRYNGDLRSCFCFQDTYQERNRLSKTVYPRLRTFCHELGYEFHVVDMRWGVRDKATDSHMATELCLKEIEQCRQLSSGPFFVVSSSQVWCLELWQKSIPIKLLNSCPSFMLTEFSRSVSKTVGCFFFFILNFAKTYEIKFLASLNIPSCRKALLLLALSYTHGIYT